MLHIAGRDKLVTIHVTAQVYLQLCWMDARVSGAGGGGESSRFHHVIVL